MGLVDSLVGEPGAVSREADGLEKGRLAFDEGVEKGLVRLRSDSKGVACVA